MAIEMKDVEVGQRVYYQPDHYPKNQWEKGVVKAIGRSRDSVFVVYNCNDDWNNYENYTAALTNLRDLNFGWAPVEHEILTFLEKHG